MLRVFPNPSRDFTIEVDLKSAGETVVEIYDITGRKAGHLFDGKLSDGQHIMRWSADPAAYKPGMYLLRLQTKEISEAVRLIVE